MQHDSNEGPNPSGLCMCGCGQPTRLAPYTRAARGWVGGKPLMYIGSHRRIDDLTLANPSGLCKCGCGERTKLAPHNRKTRGWIKGQPQSYIRGHEKRGHVPTAETRAKISAAQKGRPHPKGPESGAWRGGTKLLRGRLMVNVGLDHPMTRSQVYVLAHRLVAYEVLGRVIEDHEHVHHIDLDPTNNEPENLSLLDNRRHRRLHWLVVKGMDPVAALREVGGTRITETTPSPPA